ncbi:MAG TPA: rhamnulokinase family protein [Candidatus Izemoplasmatales bacterium]|nr:rhamnulokinase family protein [Candidatus Izemoplasmatales bacterium]
MNKNYYLAIDIGASSGRHVLAWREGDGIAMREIYRFSHHAVPHGDGWIWDIEQMKTHVVNGLKKCHEIGLTPCGIGIDTFGVDYALLNAKGEILGNVHSYRDLRTLPAKAEVARHLSERDQFQKTGIQPQVFNTIYQLMADRMSGKLADADQILLLPSYLTYFLTGVPHNESTIASTTGLLDLTTGGWNEELLDLLDLTPVQFAPLVLPGSRIGSLTASIQEAVGFDSTVYAVGAHDTASAVLGSLCDRNTAFLSSGTWSLLGLTLPQPIVTEEARQNGFTNEVGVGGTIRFLKNIMGLWMVQEVRREQEVVLSYPEIAELAAHHRDYSGHVDVTDQRFLSPVSMTEAIKGFLRETHQPEPANLGELYFCLYRSLAMEYAKTLRQLEDLRQRPISALNIIGGGSQNALLNELTEQTTHKKIIAGPVEATALGNVLAQMIASREVEDIAHARVLAEATRLME